MSSSSADGRAPFELLVEGGASLRVLAFRGREAVSRPFRFDVEVIHDDAAALLGRRATLELHGDGSPLRQIHGLVDACVARHHESRRVLSVRLVPRLARLRRRRTRRVFQERTTLEVAAAIFGEWDVPFRAVVPRQLPRRAYAVQYDETDLAFVERLLAEDGLFYGFEHADSAAGGDAVLIADRGADLPWISGSRCLTFRPEARGAGARTHEDSVLEITKRVATTVRRARVGGYDHRRPQLELQDLAGTGAVETHDEHEGSYEDDLAARPARVRLEAEASRALRFNAVTHCRRLEPLRRVELDEAGGEIIATSVRHEGYGGERIPEGKVRYRNRVEFLPADAQPRPSWRPPKPRQVSETAVVVGPPGSEIHMDPQGRIKVRFHWDREAKGDETSSCWLRVLTPWAGAGWGVQFTPRVGMEVLVTFIGGDVDRPVCAGTLVNAVHPMPFGAELSGIRTQSTPGGGNANELSFDDHRGAERLVLRAARDMDEQVGNVQRTVVGTMRDVLVGGFDALRVAGERRVEVGEARHVEVGGDSRSVVRGARESTTGGHREHAVAGDDVLRVAGDRIVEIAGRSTTVVGMPEDVSHREDYVFGTHTIGADERVEVRSGSELVLSCGESSIVLLPGRIILNAPVIEIGAREELRCARKDGGALALSEEVEMMAKAVRVFTSGAALELDDEVKTRGAAIRLGYDASAPAASAAASPPSTVLLDLLVADADFEPLANAKYHLVVAGRRFEGTTGGDGSLAVDIPADARSATLRVWERDYPTGPQLLYAIELGDLAPKGDVRGVKARLRNLGYFDGVVDDESCDELSAALREFQGDHAETHDLEASGGPDRPTQGAVVDVHGS